MFDAVASEIVRPFVKICGITNAGDAMAAIEFGADALGFNFYPGSKRFVPPGKAREWIGALPDGIPKVAVLVNPDWKEAIATSALPGITGLQLHGAETPEFCGRLAERGILFTKALPVTTAEALRSAPSFFTHTLLLDSAGMGEFGGSGRTFPWEIAREFVLANPNLRVIMAGGLSADNVGRAVAEVQPFGVDVTSGVEASPGRKDHGRLQAFLAAARSA